MDLLRRQFLKGSLAISGVTAPFFMGYQLGREDKQPSPQQVSKAASRAWVRLTGKGPIALDEEESSRTRGNTDPSEPAACDIDIERTEITPDAVEESLSSLDRGRSVEWSRYRLDNTLQTTDRETVEALIRCDRTDWNDYTDDFYDCEEFAMDLRMNFINQWDLNNIGIVYDKSAQPVPHVYNIVFYPDATFDLVEPQTDAVVSPGQEDRYAFGDVAILL